MTSPTADRRQRATPDRDASWFECGGCGWRAPAGLPVPLVCPAAKPGDDTDHVLVRHLPATAAAAHALGRPTSAELNPFVRYRQRFHAWHAARALGWTDEAYVAMVERLDDAVARVDGHGFRATPFARSAELSERLGSGPGGGVWVKDETGNVSGSHKARHLFGTLLELEIRAAVAAAAGMALAGDAPLAIASCGNAALAAAVVASAADRPLDVFIPTDADPAVVARLRALGARLVVCEREPGIPGDPTVHRLLEAVADGAIPFTCQGNLNAFAVEGGETLAWEMADALDAEGTRLDRIVVQVGGGALASACAAGLAEAWAGPGPAGPPGNAGSPVPTARPRFDTVQTRGAWPLARAHERLLARVAAGMAPGEALAYAARHRGEFMWPWETPPHSVAHGILDDETYDWLAVERGMLITGGSAIVVDEATLLAANDLAREATGIDVDHTGSSGLAGLLHLVRDGALVRQRDVRPDETVAVIFSGIRRSSDVRRSGDDASSPDPTGPGTAAGQQEDPRS